MLKRLLNFEHDSQLQVSFQLSINTESEFFFHNLATVKLFFYCLLTNNESMSHWENKNKEWFFLSISMFYIGYSK